MSDTRQLHERGSILVVVILFIATAIAALAMITSGRVVSESRYQGVLESEARAYNEAFARLHLALNVVDNSPYDMENHNLELQAAVSGTHGGTAGGEPDDSETWLRDPGGVLHGKIRGTDVRAYRGRDYIKRLAGLKGETIPSTVDPDELSKNYFVLEAVGRAGDQMQVMSALVRENEPFSSFVFFQNRHPLGVSGTPRGLIHSNDRIDFYFPRGEYVDSVSAVNGFGYEAGATTENTSISNGNPAAAPISLESVDFDELKSRSNLFVGGDGLDAEIRLFGDGKVRVDQFTAPRFDWVNHEYTTNVIVGYTEEVTTVTQQVQVGTQPETRTRQVVVGYEQETYTVDVPVYEPQTVERTRQIPIYETQLVTRTRWVRIFVPYDDGSAGGGTAVGGGGGTAGEYVWVQEEYQAEEQVIVGYNTEVYTETVQVQVGTITETRIRDVPVYAEETYTVQVPVYEEQTVEVTNNVPIYETQTYTQAVWVLIPPTLVDTTWLDVHDTAGTLFIDGRITRLQGDLNGRLTVVGNEKVRVTGNLRYVDDEGDTAMLNGGDYTQPYERNPDYQGHSTLGVIARDDVVITDRVPSQAEINATLMSTTGRVGIDGFAITEAGEPTTDYMLGLTPEERARETAYDATSYRTRQFTKDSLRRLGGIISNDRILETFIRPRGDGTSYVDAGFKRGNMKYDINLMFNPPPNFVEVPRPVLTYYAPVHFVRGEDA
jgi:hypothetical protein